MGKKQGALLVAGKYTLKELGLSSRKIPAKTQSAFIMTFMSVTLEKQVVDLIDRVLCLSCEVYETVVPIEVRRWYSMRSEQGWPERLTGCALGSYKEHDTLDLDLGNVPGANLISLRNFSNTVLFAGSKEYLMEDLGFHWGIRSNYYLPFPSDRIPFHCLPPDLEKKLKDLQKDIVSFNKTYKELWRSLRAAIHATDNIEDLFQRMPGADEVWFEMRRREADSREESKKATCSDIPQVDLFAKVIKSIKEAGK